jgi:transcriptional regulator with XRE-family HTH domain
MNADVVLRRARARSGLTIRQLARRAHTSHSAVAAYESGAKSPNAATLDRLVAACGFELRVGLVRSDPFADRAARGRELLEVLDLADLLPSVHRPLTQKRFGAA